MRKYLGKRYGDTSTNLILTEKAQKVYNVTDPIDIYEREEKDDELVYSMRGVIVKDDLSADDVNQILEGFADEIFADDE
jgi:hypothetical protein